MSTQTAEKIYKEVKAIRKETESLKELVYFLLRDSEGEYKASFVGRTGKQLLSKPAYSFSTKKDFLALIS